MSKLPIPPKSKWDFSEAEEYTGTRREITACVAEVEWRKRAARWDALIYRLWRRWWDSGGNSRYPAAVNEPRTERFRAQSSACYANAMQAREWGKE
jgi:hypothetical protein